MKEKHSPSLSLAVFPGVHGHHKSNDSYYNNNEPPSLMLPTTLQQHVSYMAETLHDIQMIKNKYD